MAGVKPNGLEGLREEAYDRGRLVVDGFNRVAGYEDIYAIGDTSVMKSEEYPRGHPQVAQVALQMARQLAKNLNAGAAGRAFVPFVYKDKGSLATIGRNAAVADLGRFRFGGRVAWWLWLTVHIFSIAGMRNRIAVFLDWMWSYFNYDVSLRLLIRPKYNRMYNRE